MNTSKTSGNEETFHTGVVACCIDGTKLLPLLTVKTKTMSEDEIPCGFSCMSRLLDERMKRNEAVAMESVIKMSKRSFLVLGQFSSHQMEAKN